MPRPPAPPLRALLLVLPAVVVACSGACKQQSSGKTLLVSAAMSLRDAFVEAGRRFERMHPGVRVQFNFASSGTLATQILRGAPVDLFASASLHHMDRVARGGRLRPGDGHDFARNRLAIIRPRDHGKRVRNVRDLLLLSRIAVGNPETVPAGRFARAMLVHYGLWNRLKERLIYGEHVRQVLDYVARNEADAGIVYYTDYRLRKKEVALIAVAKSHSHPPIIYPVSVLKDCRKPELARLFVRLLLSPEGRSILARHGFVPARGSR